MRAFLTSIPTLTALAVVLCASQAQAQFDLQITEIWPGNTTGTTDITSDWFEVTNCGTSIFDTAVDGNLYFDDDSQDPTTADLMTIGAGFTIGVGESVLFTDDADTNALVAAWGSSFQAGIYSGSGLSGTNGDGVTLFLDADMDGTVVAGDIIDFETFPSNAPAPGASYDVDLGALSSIGNASGAFQSAVSNDAGEFGIGSPGLTAKAVPEPSSLALISMVSMIGFARRRR